MTVAVVVTLYIKTAGSIFTGTRVTGVNVHLTVKSSEAERTFTGVAGDLVVADGVVLTGTTLTLVDVPLTVAASIAW